MRNLRKFTIEASTYQSPPPGFEVGSPVRYEGKIYKVVASTHTHSQLEGLRYAVSNAWLKAVRSKKQKASS